MNSSLMSSLFGSKMRTIWSARSANHEVMSWKEYSRSTCFRPLRTPGVSTIVSSWRSRDGHCAPMSRPRNPDPNCCSPWNGLDGSTARVLPGVVRSCAPSITTTKRSVVGSGPMWHPGYSRPRRCCTKVDLPAE